MEYYVIDFIAGLISLTFNANEMNIADKDNGN